jgi:hypothetical protein
MSIRRQRSLQNGNQVVPYTTGFLQVGQGTVRGIPKPLYKPLAQGGAERIGLGLRAPAHIASTEPRRSQSGPLRKATVGRSLTFAALCWGRCSGRRISGLQKM